MTLRSARTSQITKRLRVVLRKTWTLKKLISEHS